jgi:hypothetical protein
LPRCLHRRDCQVFTTPSVDSFSSAQRPAILRTLHLKSKEPRGVCPWALFLLQPCPPVERVAVTLQTVVTRSGSFKSDVHRGTAGPGASVNLNFRLNDQTPISEEPFLATRSRDPGKDGGSQNRPFTYLPATLQLPASCDDYVAMRRLRTRVPVHPAERMFLVQEQPCH